MPTFLHLPITHTHPINNPIHKRHPLHQHRIFLLRRPIILPLPLRKPPPDRLNHLPEPVKIKRIQHYVTRQIHRTQPSRYIGPTRIAHHLIASIPSLFQDAGVLDVESGPNVSVDTDGLVGAPDEAAAEKGGEEEDAVVPLGPRPGHVEFVEEPVEVEEGGGELVEDKCGAVEVDEWPLEGLLASV